MVADGTSGVLVRGHDPRLWADAIGALLADPRLRAELGVGARRNAMRMGWDAAAASMVKVYELAAQRRGSQVPSASSGR